MSIKNKRKSKTNSEQLDDVTESISIINSNILNSVNVKAFERLVTPTSNLVLRYKLSDYNRGHNSLFDNHNLSECYTQFEYVCKNGTTYNLIILCKTQEGKVFGLYTPRLNYYTKPNDKDKPYFFSLDMNITIGKRTKTKHDSYVYTEFGKGCSALAVDIEDYQFDLFNRGNIEGKIETIIDIVQRDNKVAYDMFSPYIYREGNEIGIMINYQEIEVYQIMDNVNSFETTIITNDNRNVFEDLIGKSGSENLICSNLVPKDLKLVQAFTLDNHYLDSRINIKQLYDIVIVVKTLDNHTFGICKKDHETYFYSVDLNEKYMLSNVEIIIDVRRIKVKSRDYYLYLTTDYGDSGYIYINYDNIFDGHSINEIVGNVIPNKAESWMTARKYAKTYEFKWLEVNLYEIPTLKPEIITLDDRNILENLISMKSTKLNPVCVLTNNDCHIVPNVRLKRNPNVVIVVKTVSNFIFAICKNYNEAYFCSISLNERYPLTHAKILIDFSRGDIKVQSDELYLDFIDSDPIGCIELKDKNLLTDKSCSEYSLNEIIGPTTHKVDRTYALGFYNLNSVDSYKMLRGNFDKMSSYGYSQLFKPSSYDFTGFKWMEIDVYEIRD